MTKQWMQLINYLQENDYTWTLNGSDIVMLQLSILLNDNSSLEISSHPDYEFEMRKMTFNKFEYIIKWIES